ncbi:MAG: M20/M25/M40 family metallo-hydrolase, partial [Candidatus Omnitrophica bacterium]|nr:M20/M25/M40 family metallo-hydrolase [Candidatus Omnitrophota bacterium]
GVRAGADRRQPSPPPVPPAPTGLRLLSIEGGTAENIIPARCVAQVSVTPASRPAFVARCPRGMTITPRRLPAGWHPTLPWPDVAAYLAGLASLLAPYQKTRDRAFAPPGLTSAVTRLRVVEGALVLTFDVRSLPGQDLGRIAQRCESLAWTLFGPPGDRWQFRRERQNPALQTSPTAPVVRLMRAAMRAARVPVALAAKSGCSEAGWYQMVGIPSIVFGPGQAQGNIHQPNERTSLRQLRRAIAVYHAALERACT